MRASPASTVAGKDAALAPPGTAGLPVAAEGVAAAVVAATIAAATENVPG